MLIMRVLWWYFADGSESQSWSRDARRRFTSSINAWRPAESVIHSHDAGIRDDAANEPRPSSAWNTDVDHTGTDADGAAADVRHPDAGNGMRHWSPSAQWRCTNHIIIIISVSLQSMMMLVFVSLRFGLRLVAW